MCKTDQAYQAAGEAWTKLIQTHIVTDRQQLNIAFQARAVRCPTKMTELIVGMGIEIKGDADDVEYPWAISVGTADQPAYEIGVSIPRPPAPSCSTRRKVQ